MKFRRRIIGNINGIYFNNNSFDLTYFHTSLNHKIISFSYRNVQSFTSQFFQQSIRPIKIIHSDTFAYIFQSSSINLVHLYLQVHARVHSSVAPSILRSHRSPRNNKLNSKRGRGKWWPGFGESISCPSKGRPISRGDKTEGGEGPY